MTFREKLEKEYPECIDSTCGGGCNGCPYNYGYEEEFNCGDMDCTDCWNREIPKTYEEGLNDAWELASKITKAKEDGGFTSVEMMGIFANTSPAYVMHRYSYQEALAKLKAYEETQEIKVGDVVEVHDEVGVVVWIGMEIDSYSILHEDGRFSIGQSKEMIKKTSRHIDVAGFLGQIRGAI